MLPGALSLLPAKEEQRLKPVMAAQEEALLRVAQLAQQWQEVPAGLIIPAALSATLLPDILMIVMPLVLLQLLAAMAATPVMAVMGAQAVLVTWALSAAQVLPVPLVMFYMWEDF
jgi:hypothetical protein